MERWVLLAFLTLAAPSVGCVESVWGLAGIEAEPPFQLVVYADGTRFGAADAPNGSLDGDDWRREIHAFRPAEGSTNLTVKVSVDLQDTGSLPDDRVQAVHATLAGPDNQTRSERFTGDGAAVWNFPGEARGVWQVEVEARGQGEVFVSAVAANDGSGLSPPG